MIGIYDFNGHYDWTFAWLERQGGTVLLREYWDEAIHQDSQRHAAELILKAGIRGMEKYWGRTLAEEGGTHQTTATENVFRLDIHDCPAKGFLNRNGLQQHRDYCDHCIGWIGPLLKKANFVVDHQHNHCGQCWWEMRHAADAGSPSQPGELSGKYDVRLYPDWKPQAQAIDTFSRATNADEKNA